MRRYNLAQPRPLLLEVRRSLHELHFTWNPFPRAVLLVEAFLPPQVAEGPDVRQREAETIHVLIAHLSQGKTAIFQAHPAEDPVIARLGGCVLQVPLVCIRSEERRVGKACRS